MLTSCGWQPGAVPMGTKLGRPKCRLSVMPSERRGCKCLFGAEGVRGADEREAGGGPGSGGGGEPGEEQGCRPALCNPPPQRLRHTSSAVSHTVTAKWSCRPQVSPLREGRRLGQRLLLRASDGVPLPSAGALGFYLQTYIARPWPSCSNFGHLLKVLQCKALEQKLIM